MRRRLAEQGVAPGFLSLRKQSPGSSRIIARAHRKMGAALDGWTWTDEGQRNGCLDRDGLMLVCPGPEGDPRGETPPVERRKARVPDNRHPGAFAKVPSVLRLSALRSLI